MVVFKTNKKFKAVQLGGPSGGCIPAELGDTIVDYDSVNATGAIMGSGGMVVMDESTCMIDLAKFFLNFTQEESCGNVPSVVWAPNVCSKFWNALRMVKVRMAILRNWKNWPIRLEIIPCAELGQTAPNPVLTTLKYFRHEYEAHIYDKKCPAKVCKPLLTYSIDPEKCTGCTVCAKKCPVNAINGSRKTLHSIDQKSASNAANASRCVNLKLFGGLIIRRTDYESIYYNRN